jgi:hypothetical protein
MIEVVEYLQENDFLVYVISGSDRFICRTFVEGVLDIPYEQIIGMDVELEATHQEGADGLKYVYTKEDTIVRTDRLIIKNLKMNKVTAIVREIGKQPVLSFGNSSGDVSMHNYTIFGNKYKSAAFMLIADDEERDYGNTEKVQKLRKQWEEDGFHVISMKDDFRTIYGDDVKKTGTFRWLEEFANPVNPPAAAAEQEAENAGVQYVMYLGTNGKDTNKPVFTEEEAMEKAREILVRHFGGYTLQEAKGGWKDGENLYQEYTLVIYLNDTTADKVHAAVWKILFDIGAVILSGFRVQKVNSCRMRLTAPYRHDSAHGTDMSRTQIQLSVFPVDQICQFVEKRIMAADDNECVFQPAFGIEQPDANFLAGCISFLSLRHLDYAVRLHK